MSLTTGRSTSCGCKRAAFATTGAQLKDVRGLPYRTWAHYGRNARVRAFEYTVSHKYIADLYHDQSGRCALSDVPISLPADKQLLGTASLDRIDNSKGYIEGNVRWVHKDLNIMRNDFTDEEFIRWCQLVVQHSTN